MVIQRISRFNMQKQIISLFKIKTPLLNGINISNKASHLFFILL